MEQNTQPPEGQVRQSCRLLCRQCSQYTSIACAWFLAPASWRACVKNNQTSTEPNDFTTCWASFHSAQPTLLPPFTPLITFKPTYRRSGFNPTASPSCQGAPRPTQRSIATPQTSNQHSMCTKPVCIFPPRLGHSYPPARLPPTGFPLKFHQLRIIHN
jgi:hypothetical protein